MKIGTDKILHFCWSAFITYGAIAIVEGFWDTEIWGKVIGFFVGLGFGFLKEYKIDKAPSKGDLIADVLGCLFGVGLGIFYTLFVK